MNKIQSKMKVLECSKHYTLFFQCSRAANSVVGDGIWQKFKPIQALMAVLVTSKNDEVKALECSKHFPHYKYIENFSDVQGQLTP